MSVIGDLGACRPLRRDAERNRQRVIDAAREVFAQRGLAATLDDVAHHAGVGVGTVYRRFPTKEALVEVALASRLAEFTELADEAMRAPTGWAGLTMLLCRSAEMHAADRGLRDVALNAGLSPRGPGKEDTRIIPVVQHLLDRAHAEGELRPDATIEDLLMVMLMVSEVAHHSRGIRPDAYGRYLQLLIDGLRPSPDAGDLGRPLTRTEADTLAARWLPNCDPRH
ncbi:TetR/AcrR family transcriptional regulator [Actinoplanes sp. NPDC051494]|uniref:TetR/AcrR family transcriptional regulator n=1 Tax=Actinoplanes sp. NPDC051494 TaxID=3363907 RepID=UPI0037976252